MKRLLTLLLLGACTTQVRPTPQNRCVPTELWRLPQTYAAVPDVTLTNGIPVDTSGSRVDLFDLERRVQAVAKCLHVEPTAGCPVIKIVTDTVKSCYGSYELLTKFPAPRDGCIAKGQQPSMGCPCYWRAGIESDGTVVVAPDLYNLGDPLVRIWAKTDEPWSPQYMPCANAGGGPKPN